VLTGVLFAICVSSVWIAVCLTNIADDAGRIRRLLEDGQEIPDDIARKLLARAGYVTQISQDSPLKTPKDPATQLNKIHDSIRELISAVERKK